MNSAVEGRVSRVKRSAIGEADARRALLTLVPEAPTSGEPGGHEYVLANAMVTRLACHDSDLRTASTSEVARMSSGPPMMWFIT